MSERLTKRDLRTINAALALYEASTDDDQPDIYDDSDEAEAFREAWVRYDDHVKAVRRKVWARIGDDYDDGRPVSS